jgi:hypothetical protein
MPVRRPLDIVPIMVRMRESLRRKLAKSAESNGLSLNAAIVERLEVSFIRDNQIERDSEIVSLLVADSHYSTAILRQIVLAFQKHQDWTDTKSGIDEMAERVAYYVRAIPTDPLWIDYEAHKALSSLGALKKND